jgi:hypothetical protein
MPSVRAHYRTLSSGRRIRISAHERRVPTSARLGGLTGLVVLVMGLWLLNSCGNTETGVKNVTPAKVSPSPTITELPRFVVP